MERQETRSRNMSPLARPPRLDARLEVTAHVKCDITSCLPLSSPPPPSSRGIRPRLLTSRQQPSPPPPPPPPPPTPPSPDPPSTIQLGPGSSSANMTAPADDDKCRGGKAITESARCSMEALAALITSRLWRGFSLFPPPLNSRASAQWSHRPAGHRRRAWKFLLLLAKMLPSVRMRSGMQIIKSEGVSPRR